MPLVNVKQGQNVQIFHTDLVNLYGCSIGDNTKIGTFVEIQENVVIGKNCKISSHTFICEGVSIDDDVFIGHGVMFINDPMPRATIGSKLQTKEDWVVIPTKIGKGASVGTGAVILCGITIGAGALIGAGAVVTKDVPANQVVCGNPARLMIRN